MSFISIGVITLIGVFSFPLLGKIEDRKISVLKFFNMLTLEQVQDMIDKGKEFQLEFESMTRANDGKFKYHSKFCMCFILAYRRGCRGAQRERGKYELERRR